MRITNEQVFILHVRPWRETSLLIEALSANFGRMGLLARGVQGPKRQVLRAALQPLQFVRVDAVQRGELAQLRSAEALDAAPLPGGEATLAAFYVNELVLRLAARGDPQPDLFDAYGRMRARLAMAGSLAWSLRRFERDLLDAIGFGMDFSSDGDGNPVDPAARYRLDPEHGPRRLLSDRGLVAAGVIRDRSPSRSQDFRLRPPRWCNSTGRSARRRLARSSAPGASSSAASASSARPVAASLRSPWPRSLSRRRGPCSGSRR